MKSLLLLTRIKHAPWWLAHHGSTVMACARMYLPLCDRLTGRAGVGHSFWLRLHIRNLTKRNSERDCTLRLLTAFIVTAFAIGSTGQLPPPSLTQLHSGPNASGSDPQ